MLTLRYFHRCILARSGKFGNFPKLARIFFLLRNGQRNSIFFPLESLFVLLTRCPKSRISRVVSISYRWFRRDVIGRSSIRVSKARVLAFCLCVAPHPVLPRTYICTYSTYMRLTCSVHDPYPLLCPAIDRAPSLHPHGD